ncbi:MAG: cupin domain-containing protein [Deltaproteobacteria bacterium]|nr:cupin domain-containing protein [Deltaproteobacteria bacterium]
MNEKDSITYEGLSIGNKIKELRERRQLTLQDLAAKTGLPKSVLSEIEEDEIVPPVASLLKLAKALGTSMSHFFQEEAPVKISVTRSGERKKIKSRPHHRHEGEISYIYESLETKNPEKQMEPLLVEFLPMETGDMVFTSHEGEEFVFLIEGRLEFRTNDRVEILSPGDTIYFESYVNHSYRGLDDKSASAIVVVWSK